MDASLHVDFDKYELFAITASLESCKALKDHLNKEFKYRQDIARGGDV